MHSGALASVVSKVAVQEEENERGEGGEEGSKGEVSRRSSRSRSSQRGFRASTYFCADLINPEMDEIVITPVWYFS